MSDTRTKAIFELKRLHAVLRAASAEIEAVDSDIGAVAIERAGLVIMCEMRMRAIEDTIRRINKGKEEVL